MDTKLIAQKFRELADLFDGQGSSTNSVSAPRKFGEEETLTGVVANPTIKQGSRGNFIVFTLLYTQKGDVSAKSFKADCLDIENFEGKKIVCTGSFQEFKGYNDFVVSSYKISDTDSSSEKANNSKADDIEDDNVPF